jgi:hypothetical protein
VEARDVAITRLAVNAARPSLGDAGNDPAVVDGEDASDSWAACLQQILGRWV